MARSTISGIYSITHKADGKVYVGQSQNIAKRIRHHKNHDQDCTHLCNAINLYGWDAFEIAVLEEVDDYNLLNDREQYWMDTLEAYNPKKGYNILQWADGKATRTKSKETKPTNELLTVAQAAKLLNIHPRTLRRWTKTGIAQDLRTPTNQRRFTLAEVERLMPRTTDHQEAA